MLQAAVFNAHPRSLAANEATADQLSPDAEHSFFVKALLRLGGYYSRESRLLRGEGWLRCAGS